MMMENIRLLYQP